MYNTPVEYYYDALKPQFELYLTTTHNKVGTVGSAELKDAALQSCGSLFHIRDHLKIDIGEHFSRIYVAKLFPDFDLIGDVFNASKHGVIKRAGQLIKGSSDIQDGTLVTRFKDNIGVFSDHRPTIFVKPIKGRDIDLLLPVTNVYNFWTEFMFNQRYITNPEYIKYEGEKLLTREEVFLYNGVQFQMRKGLKEKNIRLIVRSYDYTTGQFEYGSA